MRNDVRENTETVNDFYNPAVQEESWIRRTWGGWPRTLFIILIVMPFSASPLATIDDPSAWVSLSVGLLTFIATIAILFNPANPDRSAIASLAAFTGASIIATIAGGEMVLSLLFVYIVYEVSAYSFRAMRPLLGVWIFLGAVLSVLFNSNLVDHFSQQDEAFWGLTIREVKTILSYAVSAILVLIATSIPWFIGKFMRGRRRAQTAG